MNHLKIKLVVLALVVISLLVLFGGSAPILAESPNPAVPTAAIPTPARKPTVGATSPAKVPTRAFVAPTVAKPAAKPASSNQSRAMSAVAWQSGYQLRNLSGSAASISITYYNQNGTVAATVTDSVPANSANTYTQPITHVTTGFNGSAVVSSNQPLAAIVNTLSTDMTLQASTTGFASGGTTFNAPLIMCNNSGFGTFFNVQNAGTSTANVTINYIPGSTGTAQSESTTIPAGSAKTFDQSAGSTTVNCSTLAGASGKFIGSAVVTSTNGQPIVGSVFELNTTTFKTFFGYNGFSAGTPTVGIPLVMANNNTFYTSMQIQNVHASQSTTVTVTYTPNTAGAGTPVVETFTLAAGAAKTIIHSAAPPANGSANNWGTFGKYIGAATITTSPSTPIVAMVNEQSLGLGGLGPFGAAYEGFNPAAATGNASAPLIMSNNSNYYTSMQVQNVGGSTCNPISVTYSANTVGSNNPSTETFSLAAGQSKTIIHNGAPPANGSVNNWNTIGRYIGSAAVTGSGCQLVAIVNQQNFTAAGDRFTSYDAINY